VPRHATKPGRVDLGLERGQEPILSKAAVLPVSGMLVVALGAVVHSLIAALVLFPQLILLAQILAATVAGGLALWIMKDDQERAGAEKKFKGHSRARIPQAHFCTTGARPRHRRVR